ncbi:MAG: hypothetical protein ACJAZB_000952 [Psychrosphaera sp.]|jgi:hypothetical protein
MAYPLGIHSILRKKYMRITLLLLLTLFQNQVSAKDFDLSLGFGTPYFLLTEVSTVISDDYRAYVNFKMGLDNGVSIGLEKAVINDSHLIGLFAGSVGTQAPDCYENETYTDFDGALSDVVKCAFGVIAQKTLNGVGVSYSYANNGINNSGFIIKFDLGTGTNSYTDGYQSSAGIALMYSF